jgi:cytochrome c553
MACHGPSGRGNEPAKFPALRGQQSVYVVKQLNDYASGARATGPNGIMETIAKRLSAEDIRNLASYVQGMR